MKNERRTVMLFASQHARLVEDAKNNNDAKLSSQIAAYQRLWAIAPQDLKIAAHLDATTEIRNAPGEVEGSINDACNATQQAALDLRKTVDELFADGRLTKQERAAIRRKAKAVEEAACGVAVHANEPALSSA